MNLEIFKIPDVSGRMSKESFLLKNHPEEYNFIVNYCEANNIVDIPFKEKVYLCLNNIQSVPICKNPNCNKNVNYKNSTLGYNDYCNIKCISSDPNIQIKKDEKSYKKYGTKSPTQSKEVKDKAEQTNIKRYGGKSAMSSKIIQEKSKQTLLKNWGVDNPNKSKELVDKRVLSFKKNSDKWQKKIRQTCLEKYGNEHPMKLKEFSDKSKNISRVTKNNNLIKIIEDKLDIKKYKLISIDYDAFKRNVNIQCYKGHNFSINREQIYWRNKYKTEICTICNPLNTGISGLEKMMSSFIEDNYDKEILLNNRKLIYPYEIDVYLPELKIGFEFNGLYWHSSEHKESDYHYKKYKMGLDNDVHLYTIWEDDWLMKEDICKSFILNKIGKTPNKIYARKCQIKIISYIESKEFLDNNHLQGDCKSSIRLGLYYEDKLVSLMTFGKLRLPLGGKSKEGTYELTRFCNLCYTNVIGGASKLLKYFIKNYNPIEVQTYSDNMISNGNLYEKMNFKFSGESRPGYWYVIGGIRSHRFNWRKHNLVKLGYDKSKTEEQIMNELGHFRVYGNGNKKWILNQV